MNLSKQITQEVYFLRCRKFFRLLRFPDQTASAGTFYSPNIRLHNREKEVCVRGYLLSLLSK